MKNSLIAQKLKLDPRVILWILIAAYTYILPEFRAIYNFIVNNYGQSVAGRVPLVLVVILGVAYIVVSRRSKKGFMNLLYLVPGAVIAYIIMTVEPNPNKHIHIPQYTLMAWLLYAVLSKDIRGNSIFILVYIYASMLGVVDELEQGVHPARFYGWSDMIVNTSSAIIGIFTIMGLRSVKPGETESRVDWRVVKGFLWLILPGFIGAVIMCLYLWQAHLAEMFQGYYPDWMLVWNIAYLVFGADWVGASLPWYPEKV